MSGTDPTNDDIDPMYEFRAPKYVDFSSLEDDDDSNDNFFSGM